MIVLPILLNAYVFTSERGGPRSVGFNTQAPGGVMSPGVFHRIQQSQRVYGGRWTESARRAHELARALVRSDLPRQ